MAWDYRKYSGWERHPKFLALREAYGAEGMLGVDFLWGYAAEYRPKGILYDMSKAGICRACQIQPDMTEFVDFLVEVRLLDVLDDGVYAIHNWEKRQPNCFNREEISEQKRRAVKARWARERGEKAEIKSRHEIKNKVLQQDNGVDTARIHDVKRVKYPNPTVFKSLSQAPDGARARELVFGLMSECKPKVRPKSPDKWAVMLQGLLDEGQSLVDIERATRFALQDAFWRSRVLSPKAFLDNFSQFLDQAAKSEGQECQLDIASNGMSADEWDALKKAKNKHDGGVIAVSAVPP